MNRFSFLKTTLLAIVSSMFPWSKACRKLPVGFEVESHVIDGAQLYIFPTEWNKIDEEEARLFNERCDREQLAQFRVSILDRRSSLNAIPSMKTYASRLFPPNEKGAVQIEMEQIIWKTIEERIAATT